jgi:hypothetical protein
MRQSDNYNGKHVTPLIAEGQIKTNQAQAKLKGWSQVQNLYTTNSVSTTGYHGKIRQEFQDRPLNQPIARLRILLLHVLPIAGSVAACLADLTFTLPAVACLGRGAALAGRRYCFSRGW